MPYFLTNQIIKPGRQIEISGQEARHILFSRRMKKGERFFLQDSINNRFEVEIENVGKDRLVVKVLTLKTIPPEPLREVSLFISFINEKGLDFVLQKSTELGVKRILLFNAQNTPLRLTLERYQKKTARWQKILQEAAKQSGRGVPPSLDFLADKLTFLAVLREPKQIFLCDQNGARLSDAESRLLDSEWNKSGIIIGPEGGFTTEEKEEFKNLPNCQVLKLSNFILRTETAALAAVSYLLNV